MVLRLPFLIPLDLPHSRRVINRSHFLRQKPRRYAHEKGVAWLVTSPPSHPRPSQPLQKGICRYSNQNQQEDVMADQAELQCSTAPVLHINVLMIIPGMTGRNLRLPPSRKMARHPRLMLMIGLLMSRSTSSQWPPRVSPAL